MEILGRSSSGVGVLPSSLREAALAHVAAVLAEAGLEPLDEAPRWRSRGGRDGVHSRPMGYLLAEMQGVARAHPEGVW